jgi:protein associated with RNAse G/E
MSSGSPVLVRALRADGLCYRQWRAQVVHRDERGLVTWAGPGGIVMDGDQNSLWASAHTIRAFYWFERPYNLLEVSTPDGELVELYVHIASPVRRHEGAVSYTDHELDVVQPACAAAQIVDEDEFHAAAIAYGYSEEFQQRCRLACARALRLLARWPVGVEPGAGLQISDTP